MPLHPAIAACQCRLPMHPATTTYIVCHYTPPPQPASANAVVAVQAATAHCHYTLPPQPTSVARQCSLPVHPATAICHLAPMAHAQPAHAPGPRPLVQPPTRGCKAPTTPRPLRGLGPTRWAGPLWVVASHTPPTGARLLLFGGWATQPAVGAPRLAGAPRFGKAAGGPWGHPPALAPWGGGTSGWVVGWGGSPMGVAIG